MLFIFIFDIRDRITAREALRHPFIIKFAPLKKSNPTHANATTNTNTSTNVNVVNATSQSGNACPPIPIPIPIATSPSDSNSLPDSTASSLSELVIE